MRVKKLLLFTALSGIIIISGCKSHELKKDTDQIADAMCRNIEVMYKLKAARSDDTATINKLQADVNKIQDEMTNLYKEFKQKYGDKYNDKEFNKQFSTELRRNMIENCQILSKEDKEQFQKDLEKKD